MKENFKSPFQKEKSRSQITTGRVIDCNPAGYTADVLIDNLGSISACKILNLYGSDFGRDLTWINNLRGANVVLLDIGNQYGVLATIPDQIVDGTKLENVPFAGITGYGGDDKKTYGSGLLRDFSGGRPRDIFPGDKIVRVEEGAELGLFRGGIARLKASALSQIILGRLKDFIRVISRSLQIWTDFGEIDFDHDEDGKVGMHLKGGADFKAETHPSQEKYTVQIWAGKCPDDEKDRFKIKVCDATESKIVTVAFDTSGNMKIDVGGNQTESITGNSERTIQGNFDSLVQGDSSNAVAGDRNDTTLGDAQEMITGSKMIVAGTSITISATSAINLSAPAVLISSMMSITQDGPVEITAPVSFKNGITGPVTFDGLVTFNGGVVGDNT